MFKLILYVVFATAVTEPESRHMDGIYETVDKCIEAGYKEIEKIKSEEDPGARIGMTCYNPKYRIEAPTKLPPISE